MRFPALISCVVVALGCTAVYAQEQEALGDPLRETANSLAELAQDPENSPNVRVTALYGLRRGSFGRDPKINDEVFVPTIQAVSEDLSVRRWCINFLAQQNVQLTMGYYCQNLVMENYVFRRLFGDRTSFLTELANLDPPENRLSIEEIEAMEPDVWVNWIYARVAKQIDMPPESFARALDWYRYLVANYYVDHLLDIEKACIPYMSDTVYGDDGPGGLSRKDALRRINELTPLGLLATLPVPISLALARQTGASLRALAELGSQECTQ